MNEIYVEKEITENPILSRSAQIAKDYDLQFVPISFRSLTLLSQIITTLRK